MLLVSVVGFSQTTAIPDANFEAFLEANGMGDGIPNNHLVTTANIVGVTTLSIDNLGIADLTGIEDFDALQTLYARNNVITTIAFSASQNITYIWLSNNNITSVPGLQFQSNATIISLSDNPINSTLLDLTQNVNLVFLSIDSATLTSLNVRQNIALTSLTAINNNLTFLDLSFNPVLTGIEVFSNDPELCIQVTDPAAAYAGTGIYANWIKDPTATYSLNCFPCEGNLLVNGNFNAATCGGNWAFNNNCVPNWIATDHSPSIDNFPANPNAWMWSYNGIGESIAANFNFIVSTPYTISFRIRTDDMNTGCSIVANAATVNLVATNNAGVVTATPNGDVIFNGSMASYLNNWQTVSVSFIPSINFSQLWVFPFMQLNDGTCQAEMNIDDICIMEGILGVEDYKTSSIFLYPNPTKDFTTITINTDALYTLLSINGQILQQGNLSNGDNEINLSNLSSGLYFVTIKTDTDSLTKKIIKK